MPQDPTSPVHVQTSGLSARPAVLFTAFEPSGDEHASIVIAELKRRRPEMRIVAWGGPKMAAAGAEIIERTTDSAVIGMPGLSRIRQHLKVMARIDRWMKKHPTALHIPVDSPGANDPICDISRKRGIRVVHLVAPQIWAWGRWRIRKLRRRTDLLLCLFDFEVRFFEKRGVAAKYIGHPFFDVPLDVEALDAQLAGFPRGTPKVAIFPGSRPEELAKHFPLVMGAFRELTRRWGDMAGVVAAANPEAERTLREMSGKLEEGWPSNARIVTGSTNAVVRWCDLALVKSGTVTLQVARQAKPMVVFYRKGGPLFYFFVRLILATKQISLPNILAHRRVIPELVPYFGGPEAIVREADALLRNPEALERQRSDLRQVMAPLLAGGAAGRAASAIEEFLGSHTPGALGPTAHDAEVARFDHAARVARPDQAGTP